MPFIRWKPFRELEELLEDFPFAHTWDLAADVYEEDNNLVVEMHTPGIDPDRVEIEVEDNHVHIVGSRQEEQEVENKQYYRKEIKRGSFERIIALPYTVVAEDTVASFEEGVLKITLPKAVKEKKSNKIKVTKK